MRKEIGILLAWVVFLSGCVGKPMEKQNEQTKKEDAVLRLYTLKENENLWQSAKLFMEKYPKYPVVIEMGISEEDGKTVSDAIRSLNTEIMAGNGPDIILMDGLPIEDYIEKGGLEDLSDMVESVKENGEGFFENVLSSYEKGEKVYAIPSRFSVPIIIGKEGAVTPEEVKTLSGTLKTRTEEQIKGIARNATKSIPLLLLTFWNDIISEESVVDQEALSTFLEEARMLFDASEIDLELPYYSGDAGVTMAFQKDILSVDEMDMGQTLAQLESVSANSPVFYDYLNSESGKKFIPKWIFGITASSEKKEAAKAFLSYFLSSENMDQYDWTLSVNKTSFRKTLPISETKEQMTVMYPEQDSAEGIRIQKLNAEEAEEFVNFLSEADTKIAVEQALFEEILTQAEHYVYGEESLESAVNAIVEKVEIYQAE